MSFFNKIVLALSSAVLCVLFFGASSAEATAYSQLPTGLHWQPGGYEIPFSYWNIRTIFHLPGRDASGMPICQTIETPKGCMTDVLAGKMKASACTHPPAPSNATYCATHAYIPEAFRSKAKCEIVRLHVSEQDTVDYNSCAYCANGTCDFFIAGVGPIPQSKNSTGDPTTSDEPPVVITNDPQSGGGGEGGAPVAGAGEGDTATPGTGVDGGGGNGNCDPKTGTCGREGAPTLVNLLPVSTLSEFIKLILDLVVQIGSILLVLALVWTGFLFIQAQGKEESLRNARSALMWTVLGGLLLLGAEALTLLIKSTIETL